MFARVGGQAIGAAAGTYLLKKGQGAPAEPLSFTNPAYASGGAGMGSFAAAEPTYASAESAHAPASAPATGYMDVAPGSTTGYMDVAPGPLAQVGHIDLDHCRVKCRRPICFLSAKVSS